MVEEYLKPQNAQEAVGLKSKYGADSCYYSGGTEINRLNSPIHVKAVIALNGLNLNEIKADGNTLSIGSGVKLQSLVESDAVPEVLKEAAGFAVSRTIRNMATVGGNIGANRRDSYLLPALLAFKAELLIETAKGSQEISLSQYLNEGKGDLILSIKIPNVKRSCFVRRVSRTAHGSPAISVGVGAEKGKDFVVALCGAAPAVIRLEAVEKAFNNGALSEGSAIEKEVQSSVKPVSDILGSAEYKRYLAGALIAEAFEVCKG